MYEKLENSKASSVARSGAGTTNGCCKLLESTSRGSSRRTSSPSRIQFSRTLSLVRTFWKGSVQATKRSLTFSPSVEGALQQFPADLHYVRPLEANDSEIGRVLLSDGHDTYIMITGPIEKDHWTTWIVGAGEFKRLASYDGEDEAEFGHELLLVRLSET